MRLATLQRLACLSALAITTHAFGAFMEFSTASNAANGGKSVDAEVQITTSHNQIAIVLDNLQSNVSSILQDLSGLQLTLGTNESSASMLFSLDKTRTVQTSGAWADSTSNSSTSWTVSLSKNLLQLKAPANTSKKNFDLIGLPNQSTNHYQTQTGVWFSPSASFTIVCPGVTASTTVTSAGFSFPNDAPITGIVTTSQIGSTDINLPEPASASLAAIGLLALARRRRFVGKLSPI